MVSYFSGFVRRRNGMAWRLSVDHCYISDPSRNVGEKAMTPEQEAELIEKMATEICYAGFVVPYNYGGPGRYWEGVVEAKKEAYRRDARAALSIVKPIIRADALEEAKDLVDALHALEWDSKDPAYVDGFMQAVVEISEGINDLKSEGQKP
jgi:hypothetical protein